VLKPLLRMSPFAEHDPGGEKLRRQILRQSLDGLIREILLDRANGLTGKTIIHPSHAAIPDRHCCGLNSFSERASPFGTPAVSVTIGSLMRCERTTLGTSGNHTE